MAIQVDGVCRAALLAVKQFASQIVEGTISPSDGARKIASRLGDCYEFLQQDIAVVDLLAAITGRADELDELSHELETVKEVETDIIEAAGEYLRAADAAGL